MGKAKDLDENMDASGLCWLSPPDIFETLLGNPDEKGYDEKTIKKKVENAKQFICDSRPPSMEDDI